MRKREMSYQDYGITKEEKNYIFNFCQNSDEEEKQFIKIALSKLNPYISPIIFKCLVEKLSFDELDKQEYMYVSKVDFYAEKRYGVYCIKNWMILNRKWNVESEI